MLYLDIVYNLSLLLALTVLSSLIGRQRQWDTRKREVLQGLLYGSIAIIGMLYPLELVQGVIFDGRSVVISLCALFFGPLSVLIAAVMTFATRIAIGGAGVFTGTLVIGASALIGLAFRYRLLRRNKTVSSRYLLLLGVIVHGVMFLLMLTLPHDTAMTILRNVGLTMLIIYPVATVLVGKIIYEDRDKTERTARLAANEEKYRRIAENMSDIIWTSDLDGRVTFISPSAERLTGLAVKDIESRSIDELFTPSSARIIRLAVEEELALETNPSADPKRSRLEELQIYRVSREPLWVSLSASVLRDDGGQAIGFQGVVRDVSERRRVDEQLLAAKERAEESDRLKTAFLMNMSHEIRTPMNGILGFLSLLAEPGLEEKYRKEYIDIMNVSGQRLLTTINDIIEISRIETGEMDVILEDVDIAEVVENQLAFFRPQAEAKGLSLRLAVWDDGGNPVQRTDRHKLEGTLGNLINNAIKFTDHGEIELFYVRHDGTMEFAVRDTGCGIPAERIDSIFERFVQVDMQLTRKHEGSGLGLPIVKAYIDALGGSINVSSTVGEGSTFTFTIPIQPPTAA
ncbi:MAG: PAS domain S-box protein [Bacteroidetes bacterium]|nr:PAS domain S-box protein [Bacteroidota bacterium]